MKAHLLLTLLLVALLALHPASALAAAPGPVYRVAVRGQVGGSTLAVALDDTHHRAYVGVGPRLQIVDVTDPASPTLLGETPTLGGMVSAVALGGSYAYVGVGNSLYPVNITNPALPAIGHPCSTGYITGTIRDVALAGGYAYVAADAAGLKVMNLAFPSWPTLARSVPAGLAYGVAVSGTYAYVATSEYPSGTLRIVDIATPASASVVVNLTLGGAAQGVALAGAHAYVADQYAGLAAIDVSDPLAPGTPQYVPYADSYPSAQAVAATGDRVYVGDYYTGLYVLARSSDGTLSSPNQAGISGNARQVVTGGSWAYVAAESAGLRIMDAANPASMHEEGRFGGLSRLEGVALDATHLYVTRYSGASLAAIDASDPDELQVQGACNTYSYPRRVLVRGSYAYVASRYGGLEIVDVSDPSAPTKRSTYHVSGSEEAWDVALAWPYAYLIGASTEGTGGLYILNVSDPLHPTLKGRLELGAAAQAVAASGRYVYVSTRQAGGTQLHVVDVGNPAAPVRKSLLALSLSGSQNQGLDVAGSVAYVAVRQVGLFLADAADPSHPRDLGRALTGLNDVADVAVAGNQAYVAAYDDGLWILDASDPAHPGLLWHANPPGNAVGVAAIEVAGGQRACVTTEDGGLYILDFLRELYLPLAVR